MEKVTLYVIIVALAWFYFEEKRQRIKDALNIYKTKNKELIEENKELKLQLAQKEEEYS